MSEESLIEIDTKSMQKDIKKVQKALEKAEKEAIEAVQDEMIAITFDLLGEGMRRAPVAEGFLRGSGIAKINDQQTAHTESSGGGNATIQRDMKSMTLQKLINEFIGEVAFTAVYATVQHESQEFNHPHGGEAKYLENPLKEKQQRYIKGIASAVDRTLDKGGKI